MVRRVDKGGHGLRVRRWGEDEFAAAQDLWDELLKRSDADPLFMCWAWQWRWWAHHGPALGAELQVAAIYSGDRLVGLAPFYRHRAVVRRLLRPRRLELIGTAWRNSGAAFSDYLDVLAERAERERVLEALTEWLETEEWDELALCCLRRGGAADALATTYLPRIAGVREVDPLMGWRAPLPARFEDYVQRLSPEVRRKTINQRRKLDQPRLEYAHEADIDGFLDQLWAFSAVRWAGQRPRPEFQAFYRDFAQYAARTGGLRLSRVETDQGPLSVMFNIRSENCVYYLQSGFDLRKSEGISPGYLHFGYALEDACKEGAQHFDFLGGSGQNRDYKRDLLTENVALVTYHAARAPVLRTLYAAHGSRLGLKRFLAR
jgi:CelD/BcsL family acetyltransferase involved in cellulose biosynthesis